MKPLRFAIIALIALTSLMAMAQEQRTDIIIPKFLINGYFFQELPKLPENANPSYTRLKDSEPESVISQAIPREQVRNANQFLNGANMMATMLELAQAGVKDDGTFYSPKAGEPFPPFNEIDLEGRRWTNDSVKGHVMVLNLWYSGCGPCRAEMPELSTWKEQFPDVMFFSATYHDAEVVQKITEKHHFTWTHLVEAKDMMSWIGTEGFPFTVVVDKTGIVRYAVHGTSPETRVEIITKIKEAEEGI